MTIRIDGTNTAANPGITGADTDTGLQFGTDEVNIVTGGTTRATVDSNGRLGIGTSSPATTLDIEASADAYVTLQPGTTDGNAGLLINNSAGTQRGVILYDTDDNYMLFSTDNTERMRINSSGELHSSSYTTDGWWLRQGATGSASTPMMRFRASSADTRFHIEFSQGTSTVGSISATSGGTSYNTSSDYRLKENVVDLDGAIDRVKQLAPKRFNFIANADTTVDGFLAHEAQTVVPEAVTGTHNEVDGEGNPVYQGIDQSKLVPLLTAALQETIAKIETLETRVAQLEGGAS